MQRRTLVIATLFVIATSAAVAVMALAAPPEGEQVTIQPPTIAPAPLPSTDEARGRARLLHETIHSTLQVVHHQYYREDENLQIPASVMKRVFADLERRQKVEVRWLAVNAHVMNTDHEPQDAFEKSAIKALAAGDKEFEQNENGVYRLAGPITLTSDCLKCHLPNRTSTEDRLAGLVIKIRTQAP